VQLALDLTRLFATNAIERQRSRIANDWPLRHLLRRKREHKPERLRGEAESSLFYSNTEGSISSL
jgi:hypothetical protein